MWSYEQAYAYYGIPDPYAEIRRLQQELSESQYRAEESKNEYLKKCNDLEKQLQDSKFENWNLTYKLNEKEFEIKEWTTEVGKLRLNENRAATSFSAQAKIIKKLKERLNASEKKFKSIENKTGKKIREILVVFEKLEKLQEFYTTTNQKTIQSLKAENEKICEELYYLKIANSDWQETWIELQANFNKSQDVVENITEKCFLQNHQISDLKSRINLYEQKLEKLDTQFETIRTTLYQQGTYAREKKLRELLEEIQRTFKEKLVVCIGDDENEDEEEGEISC